MKILIILLLVVSCASRNQQTPKKELLPPTVEMEIGKRVAARIIHHQKLNKNEEALSYVSRLGANIVQRLGGKNQNFVFGILDSSESFSYSTPGGFVFLSKGLVKNLENEAQLVGVLAHEISHVNRKVLNRQFKITPNLEKKVWSFKADQIYKFLAQNKISANQEMEADEEAIACLVMMGYDFKEYLRYLKHQSFQKRFSQMSQFSTRLKGINSGSKINQKQFKKGINL